MIATQRPWTNFRWSTRTETAKPAIVAKAAGEKSKKPSILRLWADLMESHMDMVVRQISVD